MWVTKSAGQVIFSLLKMNLDLIEIASEILLALRGAVPGGVSNPPSAHIG